MIQADYHDYCWLVGDAAGRILAELTSSPGAGVRAASRLRSDLPAARVHLLLVQVELRRRARLKFADADRMFFTRLGLEQATDKRIGEYKAARFPPGERIWDLCCGIGGDLMSLGHQGRAIGVDRDRIAALLANANCPAAEVLVADAAHLPADVATWHIDPDRRPAGRRTTQIEFYQPGRPLIEQLLHSCPAGAIKLAPATHVPEHWGDEAELEWISCERECKQLIAWFGPLATSSGRRRATMILGRNLPPKIRTLVGHSQDRAPVAETFGRYLAEPDAAVLAANLVGTLAAEHGLSAIGPGAVYLTGDRVDLDPALAWFEIAEVLPFDMKRLKAALRHHRIGRLEIKKRGIDIEPQQLQRQLRVPGDESATLFLVRRAKSVTAVLTRRVPHSFHPTVGTER